ncbi:hypothetical protein MC885_013753 [Smutsia gigantea]|nr:hypothetical protein MC885_013753 [Smutsia gigantea]
MGIGARFWASSQSAAQEPCLGSLPRARLLHSQSGRVRRNPTGEGGAPGTSRARGSVLALFLVPAIWEDVTRRLGAGEARSSHGRGELHRAAEPGATGGRERDTGRAPAHGRRP